MMETLQHFDEQILLWINGQYNIVFDQVMIFASGKLTWVPLYLVLLYLIIKRYRQFSIAILFAIASTLVLTDQLSVHLFKEVFLRLRPCYNPELQELIRAITGCGGQYGFVSSHAANSVGLITFLFFTYKPMPKWLSTILILYALMVMYSRAYLGVHYPFDLLGGALLGILCGLITGWLLKKIAHWF